MTGELKLNSILLLLHGWIKNYWRRSCRSIGLMLQQIGQPHTSERAETRLDKIPAADALAVGAKMAVPVFH